MSAAVVVLGLLSACAGAFEHGVASGDVTASSAVLWTRADAAGEVRVQLATNTQFNPPAGEYVMTATEATDLTVKFDIDGLSPATTYYYRFIDAADAVSDVGQFRTPPADDASAGFRFIFSGDSNTRYGPFTVLDSAADENADFFVWFGDVIYGDIASPGAPVAFTRDQYRAHYRLNLGDAGLRRLLDGCPVYVGWDDHEVTDDYIGTDLSTYGSTQRLYDAYDTFFEYLPIRDAAVAADPYRTYRSFRYGALAEFFLLDVRQYRDPGAKDLCDDAANPFALLQSPAFIDEDCIAKLRAPRSMLGAEQLEWLKAGLAASTARYKFVLISEPMTFIGVLPYDRWDGYDAERREILEYIIANHIDGVWMLATDIHASLFNPDLLSYFRRSRPDYALPGGMRIPEVVTGPIAMTTLKQAVFDEVTDILPEGPVVSGGFELAFQNLADTVTSLNDLSFIEPDRYSYAVFDVDPDTGVTVTFKGISPEENAQPDPPAARVLYATAPSAPACGGFLILPVAGLSLGFVVMAWRRRA